MIHFSRENTNCHFVSFLSLNSRRRPSLKTTTKPLTPFICDTPCPNCCLKSGAPPVFISDSGREVAPQKEAAQRRGKCGSICWRTCAARHMWSTRRPGFRCVRWVRTHPQAASVTPSGIVPRQHHRVRSCPSTGSRNIGYAGAESFCAEQ